MGNGYRIGGVLLLGLLLAAPAAAGDLFRRNAPPPAADDSDDNAITVTWFEKGNAIVAESVCLELSGDDRRYPVCRQRARELFLRECELAARRYQRAELPVPELRAAMRKYCVAAETFVP